MCSVTWTNVDPLSIGTPGKDYCQTLIKYEVFHSTWMYLQNVVSKTLTVLCRSYLTPVAIWYHARGNMSNSRVLIFVLNIWGIFYEFDISYIQDQIRLTPQYLLRHVYDVIVFCRNSCISLCNRQNCFYFFPRVIWYKAHTSYHDKCHLRPHFYRVQWHAINLVRKYPPSGRIPHSSANALDIGTRNKITAIANDRFNCTIYAASPWFYELINT